MDGEGERVAADGERDEREALEAGSRGERERARLRVVRRLDICRGRERERRIRDDEVGDEDGVGLPGDERDRAEGPGRLRGDGERTGEREGASENGDGRASSAAVAGGR